MACESIPKQTIPAFVAICVLEALREDRDFSHEPVSVLYKVAECAFKKINDGIDNVRDPFYFAVYAQVCKLVHVDQHVTEPRRAQMAELLFEMMQRDQNILREDRYALNKIIDDHATKGAHFKVTSENAQSMQVQEYTHFIDATALQLKYLVQCSTELTFESEISGSRALHVDLCFVFFKTALCFLPSHVKASWCKWNLNIKSDVLCKISEWIGDDEDAGYEILRMAFRRIDEHARLTGINSASEERDSHRAWMVKNLFTLIGETADDTEFARTAFAQRHVMALLVRYASEWSDQQLVSTEVARLMQSSNMVPTEKVSEFDPRARTRGASIFANFCRFVKKLTSTTSLAESDCFRKATDHEIETAFNKMYDQLVRLIRTPVTGQIGNKTAIHGGAERHVDMMRSCWLDQTTFEGGSALHFAILSDMIEFVTVVSDVAFHVSALSSLTRYHTEMALARTYSTEGDAKASKSVTPLLIHLASKKRRRTDERSIHRGEDSGIAVYQEEGGTKLRKPR
ncbi:hypothetical protein CYMTET_35660 [Cymbomonas tetramitiformis]|uniref:Uncharacterized protein n=1 Tax=Cymbomonas tetramitiformis TaxID=36881 RepID=A0AAE0F8S6_9CHLO|nr:hypothetical protein CYMTET_35660 [Cymbomonas tetramitiformis]|eukprot:gene64-92_t